MSTPLKDPSMFRPFESNPEFPKQEEAILEFWREHSIYDQSLAQRADGKKYVFFEGPPTANGKPHPGHCLTRAIKDLFPRYKTMRGYYCERKAGWDTHGLPVEVEVCKALGIHSKEDIEEYGVEPFIQKCQQSVFQYMQDWEQLTERLGFWVKLENAYVTYHQSYVESVWWSLKNLFDRGLLYQGHKIIWWWAQGGTALSSGEVGQGYKTVMDPSVYVLFPLVDRENTSLLVWTTTPWTLPSNQFAAVNEKIEYATVYDAELGQNVVFAKDLVEKISTKVKRELEIKSTEMGTSLVGERYVPPFDYYYKSMGEQTGERLDGETEHLGWRVTAANFVTTDSGSGAVHEAPAFGEVDYELLVAEQARFKRGQGPEMICAVAPNGKFTAEAPDYEGVWVKDADKPIARRLKDEGKLYHQEQYQHEYPFCWRADDDPLIQYPRESWFIKTTKFKDQMLANNEQINWLPGHIKNGRFGNFLESNVDWALSRERYWGTPLPIWVCESTGESEAVAGYPELMAKPGMTGTEVWEAAKAENPELAEDLKVHKPYIDHITYDSPFKPGARMKRVPEVIDCWYDSGAMPFAQWGYPHQGKEQFEAQFPADFISEALDQTRGWFYSQLAISTLLFGEDAAEGHSTVPYPHPFKNCIVLGLMLSEWWQDADKNIYLSPEEAKAAPGKVEHKVGKMSKSLRNYRAPNEIFDQYGADALRWFFFAKQPPWTSIQYSERQIKESIPEFLLRLWNVYNGFFIQYANLDGFSPASLTNPGDLSSENLQDGDGYRPVDERSELDRWVLSELHQTLDEVIKSMDAYDNYGACCRITAFVDALSNWYVRRSRDRFWSKEKQSPEKLDAYWTLYECLTTTAKMVAPFVPFMSETIWQNLSSVFGDQATKSVHLCDYPTADAGMIDENLSRRMGLLREIASSGLSARMHAKLKVRQPLSGVTVILNDPVDQEWLETHGELLKTELNVLDVTYTTDAGDYVTYQIVPNFKRLGPRVGKLMPKLKKAFAAADGASILGELTASGKSSLSVEGETIELDQEDVEVRLQANDGWAAAQGPNAVIVLATELTPELVRSGLARDVNRLVQDRRKSLDLERSDHINLWLVTDSDELKQAITENADYLKQETLASKLSLDAAGSTIAGETCSVADYELTIFIEVDGGSDA
ncbi:MAG: isoleucyl-tRNA synthetase [Mariniblastus sp.]|jgi:isoleucyl-tRNA synthetase